MEASDSVALNIVNILLLLIVLGVSIYLIVTYMQTKEKVRAALHQQEAEKKTPA